MYKIERTDTSATLPAPRRPANNREWTGRNRDNRARARLRRAFGALDPSEAIALWRRLDAGRRVMIVDAIGAERDEELLRAICAPRKSEVRNEP